jgi:hypothetical protein
MKFRIGGPFPIRFELNGAMVSGFLFGLAGVVIWVAAWRAGVRRRYVIGTGEEGVVSLTWDDVALAVTLVGIALYFVGRLVHLVAHLRRRS